MGRLRLGEAAVGFGLGGMDQIGKLDRVLNEEDRDVVAHKIPVAFLGVELHRKAANVTRQVGRALVAGHRREAHERLDRLTGPLENVGAGQVGQRFLQLEGPVRAIAARMDDPLRNALMVEMEQLLAENLILDQMRTACAHFQRVLVVGDRGAHLGGHHRMISARRLVSLAADAAALGAWRGR